MKQNIYTLSYDAHPNPEDIEQLREGLADYAKQKKGLSSTESFAFWVKDDQDHIQGGCNGVIYYGCLYVDQLWLAQGLRHQGYGTQLMQACEKLAKEKGCFCVTINTMDWEALEFYKRLGYQVEFERTGYLKDSTFYFLRKDIEGLA